MTCSKSKITSRMGESSVYDNDKHHRRYYWYRLATTGEAQSSPRGLVCRLRIGEQAARCGAL